MEAAKLEGRTYGAAILRGRAKGPPSGKAGRGGRHLGRQVVRKKLTYSNKMFITHHQRVQFIFLRLVMSISEASTIGDATS